MKNKFLILCLLLAALGALYTGLRTTTPVVQENAQEEADHHDDGAEISEQAAINAGIEVAAVGPAVIRQTLPLTGRVVLNENRTARVKARFPGIIRAVEKQIGDTVAKGDVLAKVEGNESLITYSVTSPISGVVLERNANLGDVAGDLPLFVVSDMSELWAELFVFPKDAGVIRVGQTVRVRAHEQGEVVESTITALLPQADTMSQTFIARVNLANPNGVFLAGMSIFADAVTGEREVPLAVVSSAIQRGEDGPVVYVRDGVHYQPRTLQTGVEDGDLTEITSGLNAGEMYASKNSFAVKAEIGKSSAEHAH